MAYGAPCPEKLSQNQSVAFIWSVRDQPTGLGTLHCYNGAQGRESAVTGPRICSEGEDGRPQRNLRDEPEEATPGTGSCQSNWGQWGWESKLFDPKRECCAQRNIPREGLLHQGRLCDPYPGSNSVRISVKPYFRPYVDASIAILNNPMSDEPPLS